MNGRRKCNEKNRVRVGYPTEKPPHSHSTIILPQIGMADRRFVITVAAQNDICPHGRTYPKKAAPMVSRRIVIPDIQVAEILKDLIRIFFPM